MNRSMHRVAASAVHVEICLRSRMYFGEAQGSVRSNARQGCPSAGYRTKFENNVASRRNAQPRCERVWGAARCVMSPLLFCVGVLEHAEFKEVRSESDVDDPCEETKLECGPCHRMNGRPLYYSARVVRCC